MSNTPYFGESEPESSPVTEVHAEALIRPRINGVSTKALRKAVDTLAIVPTKHKISVLARKVYNVMMHHSQEQGVEPQI